MHLEIEYYKSSAKCFRLQYCACEEQLLFICCLVPVHACVNIVCLVAFGLSPFREDSLFRESRRFDLLFSNQSFYGQGRVEFALITS